MNLPLFLALRIYGGDDARKQVSRPAVVISILGVAVGLAVMLISVAVIVGFKSQVREKIVSLGAHVQVIEPTSVGNYDTQPIQLTEEFMAQLHDYPSVRHFQRFSLKPGMIKTDLAFQGMVLKGIGPEYDRSFFQNCLIEGEFPQFSDSVSSNQVVISKSMAEKMQLKLGDKIDTYFVQDNVRARRLQVVGIYQTYFSQFDDRFLFTDICMVNRLNLWEKDQVSGVELLLYDYDQLEDATLTIGADVYEKIDDYGHEYCAVNVEQLNPAVFAWLDVLNVNIWVILVLMIGIAGFTMISGLLIIIIERTSLIGTLKSFGAANTQIRRLFLWLSVFLIGKGMLWGNVIGLTFYFLQRCFGLIPLPDPETYYMDTVPVSLSLGHFLLLNIGTLLISILMLIGPSYIIAKIKPATSIRFE